MVNGAPDDIITVRHLISAFVLRNIFLALQFIPCKKQLKYGPRFIMKEKTSIMEFATKTDEFLWNVVFATRSKNIFLKIG